MKTKSDFIHAAMMMAMMAGGSSIRPRTLHNGVEREWHPWDNIQLTKSERRGKTPEECQELRRKKWEESKGGNA